MSNFTKTCAKCGKIYEYDDAEDLKQFFYFKSGYYRNTCKECECKDHQKKFKSGQYNYRRKIRDKYFRMFTLDMKKALSEESYSG